MILTAGLVHAAFEDWLCCGGSPSLRIFLDAGFRLDRPSAGGLADGLSSDHRLCVPDASAKCAGGCGLTCCVTAMMHLFLNGLAASAGGGLTYLRNVLQYLSIRAASTLPPP